MVVKLYNSLFNSLLVMATFLLSLFGSGKAIAQFTVGNVVVLQNNGTNSAASALFLKEYNTTTLNQATPVSSVTIPTSGAARLTNSGSASSEGFITRSSDSTRIVIAGYDAAVGTASVASTASGTVNRVVDTVNHNATVGRATATQFYGGNNIRSATRSANDDYWAAGANGGTIYLGNTTTSTTVQTTVSNTRVVDIFNGNLYFSTNSGSIGIYKVTGLPTSFTSAALVITSTGSSPSPYAFAVNPAGTLIYVADDRTSSPGGIEKWVNNAGVWSQTVLSVGAGIGARGLVADFSGTNPIIYATTTDNRLVKFIDNGAGSAVTLATAPTNTSFRSVAFVPIPECAAPALSSIVTNDSCFGTHNGAIALTATGGSSPFTYSWAGTGYTDTAKNISGLYAGIYTVTVTATGGCTATLADTVTQPDAINISASSNSPICTDSTLSLTGNSTTPGVSYSWAGPGNFVSSSGDTSITNAALSSSGSYIVTAKLNSCSASDTVVVTVNQSPDVTNVVIANDTTCGGSNGSITLNGLSANTVYTVNYSANNIAQSTTITSANTGSLIIDGLPAGIYTDITVSQGACGSLPQGPFTISDPTPPSIVIGTFSNTSACGGSDGSITLNGLTASVNYTVNFTKNSIAQTPAILSAGNTGSVIIAGLTAGIYADITVTTTGCQSNAAGPVTINDPTPPSITTDTFSNTSTCGGSDGFITLNGLTASVNYTVNFSKNSISQTPVILSANNVGSVVIAGLTAGAYTDITVTATGCQSNVVGPLVVSDPNAPSLSSVSSNSPVCTDSTLTLFASSASGASYNWTGPNNFTSSLQNPVLLNVTGNNAGIYTVTATLNNCVSAPSSTTIVINLTPVITDHTTTNPTTCLGTNGNIVLEGNFTNDTSYTVSYTKNNVSQSATITAGSGTITLPGLSAGTYNNINVTASCPSNTISGVTLNDPLPPVITSAGSNSPVCVSDTLSLSIVATSGITYQWTGPNNFTSSLQGPAINNTQLIDSGTYYITVIQNGCSTADTMHVVVNPLPAAPLVNDVSVCQYGTAPTLSATGTNLLWYTTQAGGTGSNVAPVPSTSLPGLYTYYVSQTTSGCEGPRAAINVTVIPKPAPPTVTDTSYTYCQFTQAIALSANGSNILWYTANIGGTPTPGTITPATNTAGTYTYYASQTVNGCESNRAATSVIINQKPQPPVTSNITYCEGDASTPLTAQGQNLLWYTSATNGTGSADAPTPATGTPGTTTWYVSQTVNGCESDRDSIQAAVLYKPVVTIAHSLYNGCQFDTLSFYYNGNAIANAAYEWTLPVGATIISGNGAGPVVIRFDSTGINVVTLAISAPGICSNTGSDTVLIHIAPSPASITVKNDICQNEAVMVALSAASAGITDYSWNFDGGNIISSSGYSSGPFEVSWPDTGIHVIGVIAISNTQCPSLGFADTITVHPLPDASIKSPTVDNICSGDSILLNAQTVANGNIYQWSPAQFFGINNVPNIYGTIEFSTSVFLQVTNAFGCMADDSVYITAQPCCNLYFPNAFTPNNDGRDDIFRPITNGHHQLHIFRVQNRWGQTVFETVDESKGWDGIFNGVKQDIGTYYYYISYDCNNNTMEQKGELYLIR